MNFLVFKKPESNVRIYPIKTPRSADWLCRLDIILVGVISLFLVYLIFSVGPRYYEQGDLVQYVLRLGLLFLAVVTPLVLLILLAAWLDRHTTRFVAGRTFVWTDDAGIVYWLGFVGIRIPYGQMIRVQGITPTNVPKVWRAFFKLDEVSGVVIESGGGFLVAGKRYLFIEKADVFLQDLKEKLAAVPSASRVVVDGGW